MAVYSVQSVIIGVSYFARMLKLERYSTENFQINDQDLEPTLETKRQTALFFLVHYGFFHVGYLVFGGLKMVADVIMHLVEHRMLAGRKPR